MDCFIQFPEEELILIKDAYQNYLAFDIGASSGRLILAQYDNYTIKLKEIHRFTNEPISMNGKMYWDILYLVREMITGLKMVKKMELEVQGIGIDTWGVDYCYLDENDNLIGLPMSYRDSRTEKTPEELHKIISFSDVYDKTGIQMMSINTIYQMFDDKKTRPSVYNAAKTYLSIADLLNFCLTGEKRVEYTHATTTELINAKTRKWDFEIFEKLSLRMDIFPEMVYPGEKIGNLSEHIQRETGLKNIPVYAVGSHDTASAVAGTPFSDGEKVFLSCGTWSLLGIELDEPIISEKSLKANFTNEGGVENTYRFLKNINGLWIIQQLRKKWNEKNNTNYSFGDIVEATKANKNQNFSIRPSDSVFMAPLDMIEEIVNFCEREGQGKPCDLGEIASAVYNGLSNEYAETVNDLEQLIGKKISTINMIGGGIQDSHLCEITAKKTGKTVITGPIEGSVFGSIIMQLLGSKKINSLEQGREIIKKSVKLQAYN